MKENEKSCYHVPVMLSECLEGLAIRPEGVYVDVTFGGGGHSRGILSHLGERGCLYGFDQDADAERNVPDDSRFVFVRSNFRYLYNFMRYHGRLGEVDGLLADLVKAPPHQTEYTNKTAAMLQPHFCSTKYDHFNRSS